MQRSASVIGARSGPVSRLTESGPCDLGETGEPDAVTGHCRAVGSMTTGVPKLFKEVREGVSDRGGGVRSRGEAARKGRRQGKGTAVMKLTTMTQVTIDGVMQGNGAASDDRRNGFERGGWARGKGDEETRAFITQTYQRAEAFLFGRRTYELFAGSWGSIDQMRAHPIGVALNEAPKYVASTTLTAPGWEDTTVLSGDVAAAVRELKAKPGVSCRCTAVAS